MNVLVIGGGVSNERDVSLRSATAVYEAAKINSHQTMLYDWKGDDSWLKQNARSYDVVLPVLHGLGGEDGRIQTVLEDSGAAYLGSDSRVSKICFDKMKAREQIEKAGFQIPFGQLVTLEEYKTHQLFSKPHVLKPNDGGSSIDTFIFHGKPNPDMAIIESTFKTHRRMILEECITGIEATIPILDGKQLPVIEIVPPSGKTFDYENKYNGETQEICPPQSINSDLQKQLVDLGNELHSAIGCRHLSRIDVILRGEDIYILEINTMPGMTNQSLFPKAAAAAGLDFPELVDYFINLVKA